MKFIDGRLGIKLMDSLCSDRSWVSGLFDGESLKGFE